jgi:diguanylate cyclase (GGDEF)-like protein
MIAGTIRWPGRLSAAVRGWPLWDLPGWLSCFVIVVVAGYLAAIGVAVVRWAGFSGRDVGFFALVIGLSIASVELTRRSGEPAGLIKDVHAVWELTIAIFLPPVYALAGPIPRLILTQLRTRQTLVYRRVFTAAATGLSFGIASFAYHALADHARWLSPGPGPRWLEWIGVVALCGIVQWFVNHSLIMTAVKGSDSEASVRQMVFTREPLFNDGAELITTVVTAVITAASMFMVVLALPLVILLQRSHRHATLVAASRVDPKTGLLNAIAWQREARVELTRASRTHTPLALAMLDIDHFKKVNDTYGHLAGDAVLATLAATMRGLLRDYDLIGRFGGEEFCILLPHTSAAEAEQTAERLRQKLAQLIVPTGVAPHSVSLQVTVSIGVAVLESSRRDLDDLIAAADAALYRAKGEGRNCVRFSHDPAASAGAQS